MRVLPVSLNKKGSAAVLLLMMLFMGSFASDLPAQDVKKDVKKEVKTDIKKDIKKDAKKDAKSDVKNEKINESAAVDQVPGKIRLGFSPVMVVPLGALSEGMGPGFGAQVFCDYILPFKYNSMVMRGGCDLGFIYASATKLDSTSLYMIPFQPRLTLSFPLDNGFEPYVNLGLGLNYVMLAGNESESSLDPLISTAVGFTYNLVNNKNLDLFAEAGYMASFETVNGNFLTARAGVIYRFNVTGAVDEKK